MDFEHYHGFYIRWLLIFTMPTYGVNQEFRVVEGIWLHRESRQIFEKDLFYIRLAQHVLSYHLYSDHEQYLSTATE